MDEILSITLDPSNIANKYSVDFSAFHRKNGQLDAFLRSASMLDFLHSALIKIPKLDMRSKLKLDGLDYRLPKIFFIVMEDIYSLQRLYFDAVQANIVS